MFDKKINIGVLGAAKIAQRSVLPAIAELRELFNLVGIASRDKHKADLLAEQYGAVAYGSYEELVSQPELEALYIPLPNSLHYIWAKKALERKIHVLVEKSLCCSSEEVRELNILAQKHGLALVENFQFRFHSQLASFQKMIADGEIGEIRHMRSTFGFPPFSAADDIRYIAELGGGALLDAGAYTIKISQILLGGELEVQSANLTYDPHKKVDIGGSATLKQRAGNIVSQLAFGFDNFYQCHVEVWGSIGKLSTNRIFTAPPAYQPIFELEKQNIRTLITLPFDNHFVAMLQHFYHLIVGRASNDLEYLQNIKQAELVESVKRCAHAK